MACFTNLGLSIYFSANFFPMDNCITIESETGSETSEDDIFDNLIFFN